MNFPIFVARRIRQPQQATFSATVSRVGIITIALGVAVGIVALAVLFGFKNTIYQKVFVFGSHLQVSKLSLNQSFEEPPIPLHTSAYDQWQQIPGIRHRQAIAHKAGILKTPEELQGAIVKGVGKDYDWPLFKESLVEGRPIQFSDTTDAKEIILSRIIARKLNLKVGDDVVMYFVQNPPRVRKLQVVGIYETNLEEFDNQLIIGDIALIQRLNGWGADSVGGYEFFVKDFEKLDLTAKELFARLPADMRVERVTERFRPLFEWLQLLDQNTLVLFVLVLFVTCFNIASVLLVMMMERTPMVGLLKTLGSPNIQIRRIFFYVGLQLAIKGLVIGNIVGLGFCWLQYQFKIIPLDAANYFMNTVPIKFDWSSILLLNLGILALIALILLIPTLIISRIRPVQALVFKK
ncbi:ABC transporter permease [Runella sp. MFBS21]|uniref:FtsX-like permease family protein n=1 Tax=Runella sp. MFBS21 TaxID=3034018 RepID=UPI0023F993E2|nr:FtsX-like permease family protein [Runella sp. MFBS21]MDF7819062.1 ABC transporter permease [Runella sp. MFBS21]